MPRIETLLSAAMRLRQSLNFDLNKGGLITERTQQDFSILEKELESAIAALKLHGELRIFHDDYYGEPHPSEVHRATLSALAQRALSEPQAKTMEISRDEARALFSQLRTIGASTNSDDELFEALRAGHKLTAFGRILVLTSEPQG